MSFTIEPKGDDVPVVYIEGGELDGELIYIQQETHKRKAIKYKPVKCSKVEDGKLHLFPNDTTRVYYIAGPSGSGKSTAAAQYIRLYKDIHPGTKVIVFSRLDDDRSLDVIGKIHRVLIDDSIIDNPIDLKEFIDITASHPCLVLFDDIDTILDKDLQNCINNVQLQIMEMGRHHDIQIVKTSHLCNGDRKITRTVMNEMGAFSFFPSSGSWYQASYTLKTYFGLSSSQVKKIRNLHTRACTVTKSYPQILIADHYCCFLSNIDDEK